jgi:hypothetical protein
MATFKALKDLLNRLDDSVVADEPDTYEQIKTVRAWVQRTEKEAGLAS